jgi:hypothetical protein
MPKFLLFLLFIPTCLFAQNSITGKVISLANKNSVADVSVFLNNTMLGTKTLLNGSFTLNNIPNGRYTIIFSSIGYETATQSILVNKDIQIADVPLSPKVVELNEVIITAKHHRQPNRNLYLHTFLAEFLGQTKNSRNCKILNPNLIHFVYDKKNEILTATTSDFLIIENKALGYRIKYMLLSFSNDPTWGKSSYTGISLFQPMDSTAAQQLIWKQRRAETYHGSEMQFLRSCIASSLEEDGFTVWKIIRTPSETRPPDSLIARQLDILSDYPKTSPDVSKWIALAKKPAYDLTIESKPLPLYDFIKITDQKGVYAFGFPYPVMVNYFNTHNFSDKHTSFVYFAEPNAYFDSKGIIFTPQNLIVQGLWGEKRVADLLPDDYQLPAGF